MGYTFKVQTYDESKPKAEKETKPATKKKAKKTGAPKNYLSGAKNKAAKAAEIKRTAEAYRKGEFIDIKAVSKSCTK